MGMIGTLAAWVLAVILLVTGVAKLLDQPAFGNALAAVGLLPTIAARVVVLLLPWIEVVTAFALVRPGWRRAGAVIALALSLAFVAYASAGAWWQKPVQCGCLGARPVAAGWGQHALIAAAMVAAAILALRGSRAADDSR